MTDRLTMPLGEAIFSQRAIRRYKPAPIADQDLQTILLAAGRAPSATNQQPWRFLVVRNPELKRRLQDAYTEGWWHRRRAAGIMGPQDIAADDKVLQAAMRFTEEYAQAAALILVCSVHTHVTNEILTACQNMLLAARALGVGGTLTGIGGPAEPLTHQIFGIPDDVEVRFCVPLGYPQGRFGPAQRKPLSEMVFEDGWGKTPKWA